MIDKGNCAPIMVRLAWHDAGTFDVANKDQPFPKVRCTYQSPASPFLPLPCSPYSLL